MYADDVKLHKTIRCEDDAHALQSDKICITYILIDYVLIYFAFRSRRGTFLVIIIYLRWLHSYM